jgi:hypothetical protein
MERSYKNLLVANFGGAIPQKRKTSGTSRALTRAKREHMSSNMFGNT